jgi:hypothetical protein
LSSTTASVDPSGSIATTQASEAEAQPRVSVIMIFLNAERFIDEAIRSVLAQTVNDWELVLVDDGSTLVVCQRTQRFEFQAAPSVRWGIKVPLEGGV